MKQKGRSVAIIGADGQLGFDLVRAFGKGWRVAPLTHTDIDVVDAAAVRSKILEIKPSVIINTAAFHKVEDCEKNPEKSFAVNALGAYHVARAAAEVDAAVVYISTDYVFDGDRKSFEEDDPVRPLNVYGASKAAGEILTHIGNPGYYIVRTCGLFGDHPSKKGHNFVTLMLRLAKEGKEISVVNDQIVSPTYTKDLSEKIRELVEKKVPAGIYHLTNQGSVSWYEFATLIFKLAGITPRLRAVTSAERPSPVARPAVSILENRALARAGIAALRPIEAALRDYLREFSI